MVAFGRRMKERGANSSPASRPDPGLSVQIQPAFLRRPPTTGPGGRSKTSARGGEQGQDLAQQATDHGSTQRLFFWLAPTLERISNGAKR